MGYSVRQNVVSRRLQEYTLLGGNIASVGNLGRTCLVVPRMIVNIEVVAFSSSNMEASGLFFEVPNVSGWQAWTQMPLRSIEKFWWFVCNR